MIYLIYYKLIYNKGGAMKKLFIIMFVLFIPMTLSAATNTTNETENFKHYLGVGAGTTTGVGISYRYCPKDFGIQINFLP